MVKKGLTFPISFDIKIIMTNSENNDHKQLISDLFKELEITFSEVSYVASANNTYNSYTYEVLLNTKEIYESLYAKLAKMPQVKMAI